MNKGLKSLIACLDAYFNREYSDEDVRKLRKKLMFQTVQDSGSESLWKSALFQQVVVPKFYDPSRDKYFAALSAK